MNTPARAVALATIFGSITFTLRAQVPQLVNYQGRVTVGTVNFEGPGLFKFALVNGAGTTTYWSNDATSAAGSQPTAAVTLTVTKGVYSVLLGDISLTGMTAIPASVWNNADVRLRVWFNDATNGSQLLTPDQRLAPNGYFPTGSVTSAAIGPGAITTNHLADGSVTAAKLGPDVALGSASSWNTAGNAGTTPGTQFLGTSDDQALGFRVKNQRALRLEPTLSTDTVNVIGGSARNSVAANVVGATIGGGGSGDYGGSAFPNRVEANFGTVSGGGRNSIQTNAYFATIGGGDQNTIGPGALYATGAGGSANTIQLNATFATISGGNQNIIETNASGATIGGGNQNTIHPLAFSAAIAGGNQNTILPNAGYATIPGGLHNSAASFAFAAGRRAKADHTGAFVWADSQDADFASTADNQFLIRAAGNVSINKANPATALDVNGIVTATGFSGNGAGLTSLNASQLTGAIPNALLTTNQTFWRIDGNAGTTPSSAFLGTIDNTALEFKVEGSRALRLEPTLHDGHFTLAVNVIGGSWANFVQAGVRGATIAGGGQADSDRPLWDRNIVLGDFGTVSGGSANRIDGKHATVPGGLANGAAGFCSFAAGRLANARHDGAFVWADVSVDSNFDSTAANQFSIRAAGGVQLSDSTPALSFGSQTRQMLNLWGTQYGIGVQSGTLYFRCDTSPSENLVGFRWYKGGVHNDSLGAAGVGGTEMMSLTEFGLYVRGAFVSLSDRNAKENFTPVSGREVLDKVVAMPISRWNFKGDAATPHVGPMAQDFHAAFGLGTDDKHIATVDADGVALAAIQGLNQKVDEELTALRAENMELKRELSEIKQLVLKFK